MYLVNWYQSTCMERKEQRGRIFIKETSIYVQEGIKWGVNIQSQISNMILIPEKIR